MRTKPIGGMAVAKVVLTVVAGELDKRQFVFKEPTTCFVGRSCECALHFATPEHRNISRRNCLLEIDPPGIWVRDLQSTNGTFVNGNRIGALPSSVGAEWESPTDVCRLNGGDSLQVGNIVFLIHVEKVESICNPLAHP